MTSGQNLVKQRLEKALKARIPLDLSVLNEARKQLIDGNARGDQFALCVYQDPVLVTELFNKAKENSIPGDTSQPLSISAVVTRIGEAETSRFVDSLQTRATQASSSKRELLELQRSRGKRSALIARMLAQIVSKSFAEECQIAALLQCIGEMLATLVIEDVFSVMTKETTRAGCIHKLEVEYGFDVFDIGPQYLAKKGVPAELIVSGRSTAQTSKEPHSTIRKIVLAACEMVDRFDEGTWEQIAPNKELPARSAIHTLNFSDIRQYAKLYERASEYLLKIRFVESHQKNLKSDVVEKEAQVSKETDTPKEIQSTPATLVTSPAYESTVIPKPEALPAKEVEVQKARETVATETVDKPIAPKNVTPTKLADDPPTRKSLKSPVDLKKRIRAIGERKNEKLAPNLSKSVSTNTREAPSLAKKRKKEQPGVVYERNRKASASSAKNANSELFGSPTLALKNASVIIDAMSSTLLGAESCEELLSTLLSMLVDQGPFEKTALIVISKDRKNAVVVAARGPNIGNGQKLVLDDALSPLAQCLSKIQSFGREGSAVSPFGSKAFAVAPIDAQHDSPVALYADCGNEAAITFEARRIFRTVVEMINYRLKSLPGGIPNET